MLPRIRAAAPAALVLLLAAHEAAAQSSQKPGVRLTDLSLEALGELEFVSASKMPETIWDTSAAVSVMTGEEIRRSGATSLPEVLRSIPGVQVARMDSDHWAIGIRGLADSFSKSMLVLIDGRSIYTPLFAGVYWGVHDVVLDDVDRIEVIRGPGGTIWGSNAVNGVINIITKPARETRGAAASLGFGTIDHGIGQFRYGWTNGQGFDARLSGKAFMRDSLYHPDGASWDTWELGQVSFRSDWEPRIDTAITIQGGLYRGRNGQRVTVGVFDPPSQRVLDDPLRISGGNAGANWRRATGSGHLKLQFFYDRTNLDGPHFAEARDTVDADFMHTVAARRHHLAWGLGARWSPGRFRQVIPTLDFTPHHKTATLVSAFVQDEVALVDRLLHATLGAKIERNHYTGAEVQPSVRARWTPGSRHSFWGAVSRAVRTPSRIEADISLTSFALANPLAFVEIAGDPEIRAERLIGYETGYRTLLASRVMIDVTAFRHDYDNVVSNRLEVVAPPPYLLLRFPFTNGIEGTADGGQILVDTNVTPWLRLTGAYTRVLVDFRNKPGDVDVTAVSRYEGSSPRHQAQFRTSWNLPRGFQLDSSYRYVGALRFSSIPAYHTADVRVAWRATPNVELSLAGRDLLEPYHFEFPHSPGPDVGVRRSVFAQMSWTSTGRR